MSINNQKIDNLLNMALDVTEEERLRSINLETGYRPEENTWTVIVKYTGNVLELKETFSDIEITILSNQYAILILRESLIDRVAESDFIIYMEKPKRLFFTTFTARQASCITSVQAIYGSSSSADNLDGSGILVGVIDSGIDYSHPDFRNEDGSTRILELWDQTIAGDPPAGYQYGTLYTRDQINFALSKETKAEQLAICPSTDLSGHGTHVTGIAAGNGRASNGVYRGVAFQSELLIVKLGSPAKNSFPSTTELMEAVDYCVRKAEFYGKPLALNLSFGNNYGSHSGTSLVESFLNDVSGIGINCICVGTGNEGSSDGHTSGLLQTQTSSTASNTAYLGSTQNIEFTISDYESTLNLQLWKNYSDDFRIRLTDPSGTRSASIDPINGTSRYYIGNTEVLVYYGEPAPYSPYQEIYFDFLPKKDYLDSGIWTITLTAQQIVSGLWDMWMPSSSVRSATTRFLIPSADTTLTIPSTAAKVISVSAYDSYYNALAAFSGRGYTWNTRQIKPDIAAPGVDINSCAPGGGYTAKSGTSMATPFVTGSCALLMQYGIINKKDPFLYGEKVKAYFIRGARKIPARKTYPNPELGWGTLCVKDALPS